METSLQLNLKGLDTANNKVTILILVETSLQRKDIYDLERKLWGHNPYFSGNFFATIL